MPLCSLDPPFPSQTGTLSSLLTLSESLAKQDPQITASLTKTVDAIRSLTSADTIPSTSSSSSETRSSPLSSHLILDDGRPYLDYVFPPDANSPGWEWNRSKYRTESRSLGDIVESLTKEVQSIENAQRNKGTQYALVKGQLTTALRKMT